MSSADPVPADVLPGGPPILQLFETAKPPEGFMLRREGNVFRKMILKLTGRENGNTRIEWSKMWKLTKTAAKM